MEIKKIVLTGGPCAGKTTIINSVSKKLEQYGYYVITIPETARDLIGGGIKPNDDIIYQEFVLETQISKESVSERYCNSVNNKNLDFMKDKRGIIILCDRAIMDNRAYLSYDEYNDLLKRYNLNELEIVDKYDLVIDLVSVATTNPELYALDGIRYETPEEAAYKDLLTTSAWLAHSNLKVIMPMEKLEDKEEYVLELILNSLNNINEHDLVGHSLNLEKSNLSWLNNDNSKKYKIKKIKLIGNNNNAFDIEIKEYNDNISYMLKEEKMNTNGDVFIKNTPISAQEFNKLLLKNYVIEADSENIISFAVDGEYYKIVENKFGTNIFKSVNSVNKFPKGLCIDEKTLTKKKNMLI